MFVLSAVWTEVQRIDGENRWQIIALRARPISRIIAELDAEKICA